MGFIGARGTSSFQRPGEVLHREGACVLISHIVSHRYQTEIFEARFWFSNRTSYDICVKCRDRLAACFGKRYATGFPIFSVMMLQGHL
jgi:hypothetical protein